MINYLEKWSQKLNILVLFSWPFLVLFIPRSTHLPLFIIAVAGCCTHRFRNLKSLLQPEWILLSVFCVWSIASTQWSIDPTFALQDFQKVLLVFIASALAFLYFKCLDTIQIQRHFNALLTGLAITAGIIIIDRLCDYPLIELIHTSPAITYSRFIAFICLGVWGFLLKISDSSYPLLKALIVITTVTVFCWPYDFDAGPIALTIAAGVLILTIIMPKLTSYLMRLGILITPLIIVGCFGFLMSQDHWQKIAHPNTGNTHQQRLEIIDWASKRIIERPLGYGFSQTRDLSQSNTIDSYIVKDGQFNVVRLWKNGIWHLHNGFLQIFLELGLIGFLLTASIVWLLLTRLYNLKLNRYQLGVMHGYVTALLFMFSVSFGVWQTWWLSTILMLTMLFAFRISYEGKNKRDII